MKKLALLMLSIGMTVSPASAETAVERQCASGKCTCSYIASTCRAWNVKQHVDVSPCEGYRQTCLSTGRWVDRNRHIDAVVKR